MHRALPCAVHSVVQEVRGYILLRTVGGDWSLEALDVIERSCRRPNAIDADNEVVASSFALVHFHFGGCIREERC